jgi:hypothetical protein
MMAFSIGTPIRLLLGNLERQHGKRKQSTMRPTVENFSRGGRSKSCGILASLTERLLLTGLYRSGGGSASVARPDQATSRVVDHLGLRLEQFIFEGGELRVI